MFLKKQFKAETTLLSEQLTPATGFEADGLYDKH